MLILVILAGTATGIVLGLFGSGGSIIAMPALMVLLNVEAKSAIAMSLGIVAAKSYAGFFGYLGAVPIDWTIMGSFTTVTIAGTRLAHRFSQETLKRGFGGFLVVVATYILIKSTL